MDDDASSARTGLLYQKWEKKGMEGKKEQRKQSFNGGPKIRGYGAKGDPLVSFHLGHFSCSACRTYNAIGLATWAGATAEGCDDGGKITWCTGNIG